MPPILSPLDVSKFTANPCLSLTQAQATDLDISPQGKRANIESGQACTWSYDLTSDITVIYVLPDAKNGLQNLYNQRAAGSYDKGYFEPTTIEGYPAVYESGSDHRQNGQCELSAGVNEQTLFTVINSGESNLDLCKGAAKVATDVVETIKGG